MHLYPISSPSWPKRELPLMKDRLRITLETELAIREHKEHTVQIFKSLTAKHLQHASSNSHSSKLPIRASMTWGWTSSEQYDIFLY
jgi:hypothetical protein